MEGSSVLQTDSANPRAGFSRRASPAGAGGSGANCMPGLPMDHKSTKIYRVPGVCQALSACPQRPCILPAAGWKELGLGDGMLGAVDSSPVQPTRVLVPPRAGGPGVSPRPGTLSRPRPDRWCHGQPVCHAGNARSARVAQSAGSSRCEAKPRPGIAALEAACP